MTEVPGPMPPAITPRNAPARPKPVRRQVRKKARAPFLPMAPHPNGWTTRMQLAPHTTTASLLTEKK